MWRFMFAGWYANLCATLFVTGLAVCATDWLFAVAGWGGGGFVDGLVFFFGFALALSGDGVLTVSVGVGDWLEHQDGEKDEFREPAILWRSWLREMRRQGWTLEYG